MEFKAKVKNEEPGIMLKQKQEVLIQNEAKRERTGIFLKLKQEIVDKSAAQIVNK